MIDPDELASARENAIALNETFVERLAGARQDGTAVERALVYAAINFRFIGIASFLLDADVDAFHQNLYSAARCRLMYYLQILTGLRYEPSRGAVTNDEQLFDALACQSVRTAHLLSWYQFAPPNPEYDAPDHLRYTYGVRALVHPAIRERKSYQQQDVETWLAGEAASPRQQLCQALVKGDAALFNGGLAALVEQHRACYESGELAPDGDQLCCVEGLGVAWLAEQKGMSVSVDDPLLPRALMAPRTGDLSTVALPQITDAEMGEIDAFLAKKSRKTLEEIREWRPDPRE